jgi:hypothetical protein
MNKLTTIEDSLSSPYGLREALHTSLQAIARYCFDESRRMASEWYGKDAREPSLTERQVATDLGNIAERAQEAARKVFEEWVK